MTNPCSLANASFFFQNNTCRGLDPVLCIGKGDHSVLWSRLASLPIRGLGVGEADKQVQLNWDRCGPGVNNRHGGRLHPFNRSDNLRPGTPIPERSLFETHKPLQAWEAAHGPNHCAIVRFLPKGPVPVFYFTILSRTGALSITNLPFSVLPSPTVPTCSLMRSATSLASSGSMRTHP
jgi:hypothetical protein